MQYNPAPAADAATSPRMSRMRTGTSRLRVSVRWLQAQLGEVQAYSQRYVDAVKLLLAAGGRVDLPPDR